ncbi:guanyl-nucleotide exchange factor [Anaeramoeba flamelloides]|uniref:Guanyl-nucleotide exchange factor n=1 Tax=Anaeramoeba flamelloides TaxID=1746091 RepID=A0ABQ8XNJ2_9EUKA|nr:guanyl-nucleotide exchange factor [Anaeramoeba flamelloides]
MSKIFFNKNYQISTKPHVEKNENGTSYFVPLTNKSPKQKGNKKTYVVVHYLNNAGWDLFVKKHGKHLLIRTKREERIKNKSDYSTETKIVTEPKLKKETETRKEDQRIYNDSNQCLNNKSIKINQTHKKKESIRKRSIILFNNGHHEKAFSLLEGSVTNRSSYKAIAKFLFNAKNLKLSQKGKFFSSRQKFSQTVLKYYLKCFNFYQKNIEIALVDFFSTFACTNESQVLDRLSQGFANEFYTQNEKLYPSSDSVYVLVMSIILLITYITNSAIRIQLSKKQFIKNIHYTEDGKLLPKKLLKRVYNRVKKKKTFL